MLSEQDLALRRTGLTATDMTIVAGVSPYGRTVHDVYLDKLGLSEPVEQTAAMALGHRLEPVALALLADVRGLQITPGATEKHPIVTWAIASPDGNVIQSGSRVAVAEAKAVGRRMMDRWGENGDPDAIPDEVRVQVQWQCVVTRTKLAHVVALLGTEARFYDIENDEDLASSLLDLGEMFWTRHVLAQKPPDLDGSESSARMVRGLFRRATAGIVAAPPEAAPLVADYLRAKDALDQAETIKAAAQARLCAMIGAHEGLQGDDWIATWKERAGSTDWKGLAEALKPTKEMVAAWKRPGVRVLNVRERKVT